jgi:hypothetical protein
MSMMVRKPTIARKKRAVQRNHNANNLPMVPTGKSLAPQSPVADQHPNHHHHLYQQQQQQQQQQSQQHEAKKHHHPPLMLPHGDIGTLRLYRTRPSLYDAIVQLRVSQLFVFLLLNNVL